MAQISDQESLEKWLRRQSQEVAVAMACRAALRVTPRLVQHLPRSHIKEVQRQQVFQTVFRAVVISAVEAARPTELTKVAAAAAKDAASLVALYASSAHIVFNAAVSAAGIAALEEDSQSFGFAKEHVVEAADAIESAAEAFSEADVFWRAIETDAQFIEVRDRPESLFSHPLWPGLAPGTLDDDWLNLSQHLRDPTAHMAFWIDWWEDMRDGRPMDWNLQREIALLTDEDWQAGPERIAERIAEIQARYAAKATPYAEELKAREDTGKIYVVPIPPPAGYEGSLDRVADALVRAVDNRNGLRDDDFEVGLLKGTLQHHRHKPQRVHDDLTAARGILARKIETQELPNDHPPIDYLQSALADAADDIRIADETVRATVTERAKLRYDEASEDDREKIAAAGMLTAELSETDLANDVTGDLAEIENPTTPETGANALYRLLSRIPKVWKLVKSGAITVAATAAGIVAVSQAYPVVAKLGADALTWLNNAIPALLRLFGM